MSHPSLRHVSSSAAAARTANHDFSRMRTAALAALVLAAGAAFMWTAPASAAESAHATYCLSSSIDGRMDCGFTSLAQCKATASGGLGECNMMAAGPLDRGVYASYRAHAAKRGGVR